MNLGNWDDEDFEVPPRPELSFDDEEDIFEFTDSLRLDGPEDEPKKDLPPLPPGVVDLTGDRGVLLERKNDPGDGEKPSKERQFVEMHYEGFLVATGEKFDSSLEQNYAMVVQLDIPPTGKSTVIRGLEIGLRELQKGDKVILTLESRYAYGKDGAPDIPKDSDLRFEIEVLDVRETHKRVVKVDHTVKDMSRLDEVRRERELAQQRREEEAIQKDEEKKRKADRAAQLREKLANKNNKKGKKKKKK